MPAKVARIPLKEYQNKKRYYASYSHPKSVTFPERCNEFAEFLGIYFGDGSISDNPPVIVISLSYSTEKEYALFISKLIKKVFKTKAGMVQGKRTDNVQVQIYRISLVRFFEANIKRNFGIPAWIKENSNYLTSCLRGIMDSEGSVYRVERGRRRIRVELKIYNQKLLEDVCEALKSLNFHPCIYRKRNRLVLARQEEVDRYFNDVGSHNPKRMKRYLSLRGNLTFGAPVV